MNVIILEDDLNKLASIRKALESFPEMIIRSNMSYHSGLKSLLSQKYNLLLLDMSMPVYDIQAQETGGRPLPLAGRDILFQLSRRKIDIKVIVVTQYEDFDGLSLVELDKELSSEFPEHYVGYVYYNITQEGWQEKLAEMIKKEIN